MWKPANQADDDTNAYCFFESFINSAASPSFVTPEKQNVRAWLAHSHAANEIKLTHFWDGEGKPDEPPADRERRTDPLGRHQRQDAPVRGLASQQPPS